MKMLLVQPPSPPNIIGEGIAFLAKPLALEIVAAGIPHHDVKILDMRIEPNLKQELESFLKERLQQREILVTFHDLYVL